MRFERQDVSNRVREVTAVVAILGVALAGCSQPAAHAASEAPPAVVERIAGTDLSRITLSARAAQRIGLVTARVAPAPAGARTTETAIPYGAVLYDVDGDAWTFTNPEPLVFVRQAIDIDSIRGDVAILSAGPAAGTDVVTVGAAELLGAELGVEGE